MTLQPVLINGQWRQSVSPAGTFTATNPATKTPLSDEYPVSAWDEVEEALVAGRRAADELRSVRPQQIAEFLEQYALNIEARSAELVEMAHIETGYPREPRLASGELPRTTDQLRQAAAAARSASWTLTTIDTQSNIRSMYGPLGGAVAVFGPNNFPFAFNSSAGGDFAAAIVAGNPVIAKANSSHPGTTRIFTEAAFDAVQSTGLPAATVQLIYRLRHEDGTRFVSHPLIAATGFTGSKYAGLQLKSAADAAGKPIYLEMSSVNPIVVLPGALEERSEEIASEFFGSCTLGAGQFCTNPGLVLLVKGEQSEAFVEQAAALFAGATPGVLLSAGGPRDIANAIETLQQNGAEVVTGGQEMVDAAGYSYANTLLRVSGEDFLRDPDALQTEAFGPVSLIVFTDSVDELQAVISEMEGNLTGCIYSHRGGNDDELYDRVAPDLRERVGRLLNDKMPTGVAVVPSMNHGGPYPATGHPGFTAVGIPGSLLRFGALLSYDNVRAHRLPAELGDKNPTGDMWRLVDGAWTTADIA